MRLLTENRLVTTAVDHDILLERLHVTFGLSGGFLEWLNSFLTGCTLSVVHGPTRSGWAPAPYGLPQSSILGPLLYIIYTSGLSTLLAETGALGHLYADDIQAYMYIHCRPANASLVVGKMGDVLGKLETWMSSNRLRLNPAKTKFMCFGTRQQLTKLNLDDLANKFPSYTFQLQLVTLLSY